MNRINIRGITPEAITGICVLLLALANAVLQMFGIRTLPIENEEVSDIISTAFLIVTTLWNTWKNRNITTISQEVQQIADALRNGEILQEDVRNLIGRIK